MAGVMVWTRGISSPKRSLSDWGLVMVIRGFEGSSWVLMLRLMNLEMVGLPDASLQDIS